MILRLKTKTKLILNFCQFVISSNVRFSISDLALSTYLKVDMFDSKLSCLVQIRILQEYAYSCVCLYAGMFTFQIQLR